MRSLPHLSGMRLMVVGGGGREHALIRKLKENKEVECIFALPGNAGMKQDAVPVNISARDIDGICAFAKKERIDFAVVAPDDPLCQGAVDALHALGIPCFGPEKRAAEIEGSKVFAKQLMRDNGIPTAEYRVFESAGEALEYLREAPLPAVIKADGLALGKGVFIAATREEAQAAVKTVMEDRAFGQSGARIVVEEFLTGPEVSVLAFTDGETVRPMVSSMDHKRALDGDLGPNTGGMGTIAPNPYYTPEIARVCMETIFLPTVRAMKALGRTFRGCLYFGLMLTPAGPKVIEYNCRFGDPEAQVVLPLLESDLLTVMQACENGTLAQTEVRFSSGAACCVVLASGGYPGQYVTGFPITVEEGFSGTLYASGIREENGRPVTGGGRVLGVTVTATTLPQAVENAYREAGKIRFDHMHFRRDIGSRALKALD